MGLNKKLLKVDLTEDELTNLWIDLHRPPQPGENIFWSWDYADPAFKVIGSKVDRGAVTITVTPANHCK